MEATEIERVTTLELFLDLVFVFTVTQLTAFVSGRHPATAYGKAALILAMTWWMYDGYVWLTGNVSLERPPQRPPLFAGMGGFLLMAIAIPGAFDASSDAIGDRGSVRRGSSGRCAAEGTSSCTSLLASCSSPCRSEPG